jgi:hypothetical protein
LERRDPEHFGPPQARVAVEGSHPGAPLAVVHTLDAQREISDAARDFLARIGEVERRDRVVAANGNGAAD